MRGQRRSDVGRRATLLNPGFTARIDNSRPTGVSRPDAEALAYLALRITFATAQACEGAPAGPRRGLDCCSQRTAGGVKVESFLSNRANGNR